MELITKDYKELNNSCCAQNILKKLNKKMKAFYDTLNEKDRRGYAAIEAMKLGHGGQNYISSVLGCHFQTVMAGINEITQWYRNTREQDSKAWWR